MATTCGRYYFYDLNGEELKGHPLNGSVIEGAGPFIDECRETRAEIYAFIGKTQVRTITVEEFFEGKTVRVREWWPEPTACDWFLLGPAVK